MIFAQQAVSFSFLVLVLFAASTTFVYLFYVRIFAYIHRAAGYIAAVPSSSPYSLDPFREFALKDRIYMKHLQYLQNRWIYGFDDIFSESVRPFNISGNDVLVFLHIQKTAGSTFSRLLTSNLNISNPCLCSPERKKCFCYRSSQKRSIWFISRFAHGWICGLHADYTELFVSKCVDSYLDLSEGVWAKRRYFYMTIVRDPVSRLLSEYENIARGVTWRSSSHYCNGRVASPDQLPICFDPETGWKNVSIDEFLSCPFNLAFNRQTRMLADLTLVNCYDTTKMEKNMRDIIMLQSAKTNLENFSFFGLTEYLAESQWMFENVFGLRFTKISPIGYRQKHAKRLSSKQLQIVIEKNNLDMELYAFARDLFMKRLERLKSEQSCVFCSNSINSNSSS